MSRPVREHFIIRISERRLQKATAAYPPTIIIGVKHQLLAWLAKLLVFF
jgi:hypothetical protein